MGNNIGVALIVGAVMASGLYVWNSTDFSKEQKKLLLICIIFPPLHFLLILVVLVYNRYKAENTPQKLNEKNLNKNKTKLNSSIDNLYDLKQKGIITELEYQYKVEKIEDQKKEQELLISTEYKQLKNLLDSGHLTKVEFEDKIIKLKLFNPNRSKEYSNKNESNSNKENADNDKILLFIGDPLVLIIIIAAIMTCVYNFTK